MRMQESKDIIAHILSFVACKSYASKHAKQGKIGLGMAYKALSPYVGCPFSLRILYAFRNTLLRVRGSIYTRGSIGVYLYRLNACVC